MTDPFEKTGLWTRTLAKREGSDQFGEERAKLCNAYLAMRENAKQLVSLIPNDCKGITVHDITHLDAL